MNDRLNDAHVAAICSWAAPQPPLTETAIALAREVQERRAVEAKLRELHHPTDHIGRTAFARNLCAECKHWHPCPTIRLLDGGQ